MEDKRDSVKINKNEDGLEWDKAVKEVNSERNVKYDRTDDKIITLKEEHWL